MIGFAYRKFARENGMQVGSGIAYGNLRGYAASLCEGSGWKMMTVNTKISDAAAEAEIRSQLESGINRKRFSIRDAQFADGRIEILFLDTVGTMKKVKAFTQWFFPLLDGAGAEKYEICDICGMEMGNSGVWRQTGEVVWHVHPACAGRLETEIRRAEQERAENASGSYFTGLLGALVGALLGAVVWAVVYELGYIASVVGLLIAFLAVKGYELLRGRQGKGMAVLILAAVVFGVAAGNLMAYCWELMTLVLDGELPIAMGEIPGFLLYMMQDGEFLGQVIKDLGMGLVFALLGAFGAISRAAKSVGRTKVRDLK